SSDLLAVPRHANGRAVRRHHEPDVVDALTVGLPGRLVAGEGVKRPAGVRDLLRAIRALHRSDELLQDALADRHFAVEHEGRPVLGARLVTGALALRVGSEDVEGVAGPVD